MHFYDEEITIKGADIRPLNNAKIERISSRGSNSGRGNKIVTGMLKDISTVNRSWQRDTTFENSPDDDGLLQDIIDHDDEDDDDDDYSGMQTENVLTLQPLEKQQENFSKLNDKTRPHVIPMSARLTNLPTAKALDFETEPSETESEEGSHRSKEASKGHAAISKHQTITGPEKWENLSLDGEIKDLFPYILKYTPQNIDIPYHLQPFIPEYVPAVGDVDAFLKVTEPPHLQPERSQEIQDHLQKLGLYCLDEPSGNQSEPSLLNMKLRSALTGNSKSTRAYSAQAIPIAKSTKDIDKWINEVEEVHMSQSIYDAQPRKDIENIISDWPRSYAQVGSITQQAYQQCLTGHHTIMDYISILCQQFEIDGPLDKQADYLLSVQTLFSLYLAANQAWE